MKKDYYKKIMQPAPDKKTKSGEYETKDVKAAYKIYPVSTKNDPSH